MAGRPPDVTDEEILLAVARINGPATAKELAQAVGMGRSGMNKRLDDLVDDGHLHEKKVGANAKVYWLTDEGFQQISLD
jgi:predicted ArsR family transcriptional regulator